MKRLSIILRLSLVALLSVLALAVRGYFFLFDDFALIGESATRPLASLWTEPLFGFYRPAVFLITRAETSVFGWHMPWAHLAVSQLVHLANAGLVYGLMRQVGQPRAGAAVAAVLFALSPWAAETYFWVSARFDVFSVCGVLVAMVMTLRVADAQTTGDRSVGIVVGFLGAVLAVFSKETGVIVPVLCAGVLVCGRPWAVARRLAPAGYVVLVAAVSVVYLMVRQQMLPSLGGAYGDMATLAARADLPANALTYLRGLITVPQPGVSAGAAVPWIVAAMGIAAGGVALWLAGRGAPRVAAMAVIACAAAVAPVLWLPLIPFSSAAGRFLYAPGVWVSVLVGIAASQVTSRTLRACVVGVLLAGSAVSVWHQSRIWAQASALSRHAIDAFAPFVDRGIQTVMIPELPFWYAEGPYVLKDYAFARYFHGRQVPQVMVRPMVLSFGATAPIFAGWVGDAPEPAVPEGAVVVSVVPRLEGLAPRLQLEPARVGLPMSTTHIVAGASTQWAIDVSHAPHLEVRPVSGTGPAMVTITRRGGAPDRDSTMTLPVTVDGQVGAVALEVVDTPTSTDTQPPIGWVDLPAGVIEPGSAPVVLQGWALDDQRLQSVWVGYRDSADRLVSLGPAVRRGERPDVTALYRGFDDLANSAWSFVLDPAAVARLPRPLTIRVFAEDASGHRTEIGIRELR